MPVVNAGVCTLACMVRGMYGPLNGVRVALVAAAVLAAITAGAHGHWSVTLLLMVGVAVHGAGWVYLAAKARTER